MKDKQKFAIIVAGGSGKRMGGDVPKQYMRLAERPILMHTLEKFHTYDAKMTLILVLPEDQHPDWLRLIRQYAFTVPHHLANGGSERFYSVLNGLQKLDSDGLVAIHDGVRPLVSLETIDRCFEAAAIYATAIPVVPVTESVRWDNKITNKAMDRRLLFLVQTPQVFSVSLLKECYKQPFDTTFTDDASVVEKMGHEVHLVEGNPENIKITRPMDLLVAEALMNK
ncbi:MAG: 2-C-methyl-D-erythritol 4-phosphate cytidylyltransferase [Salinivirgaceae bacterium]